MKKSCFQIYALLFLLAIGFTSCTEKNDDPIIADDTEVISEEDLVTATNLYHDTEDDANTQIEARLNGDPTTGCPTVTFAKPKGTFPNTITIDYGVDGCVGPNGRTCQHLK